LQEKIKANSIRKESHSYFRKLHKNEDIICFKLRRDMRLQKKREHSWGGGDVWKKSIDPARTKKNWGGSG